MISKRDVILNYILEHKVKGSRRDVTVLGATLPGYVYCVLDYAEFKTVDAILAGEFSRYNSLIYEYINDIPYVNSDQRRYVRIGLHYDTVNGVIDFNSMGYVSSLETERKTKMMGRLHSDLRERIQGSGAAVMNSSMEYPGISMWEFSAVRYCDGGTELWRELNFKKKVGSL